MVSFSGLGEGVQLMKEGDRYVFVLPSSLALASGRVFTFDFELLSVIQEDQEEFYNHNATLDDIEVTDSGLQYQIGRASCRERGEDSVVPVSMQRKMKRDGTMVES